MGGGGSKSKPEYKVQPVNPYKVERFVNYNDNSFLNRNKNIFIGIIFIFFYMTILIIIFNSKNNSLENILLNTISKRN
jgi:hypothetical protein